MSHKQTITFPNDLHARISSEAKACGLSLNRYVIQRLNAKENIVFVNLQELTQVLVRLQQMLLKKTNIPDELVRQEVYEICRFCECSLVQMIKSIV